MNREAFYAFVRQALFGGTLTKGQVTGTDGILDMWAAFGDGDVRKLAYILATSFHETARRMEAVRETLASTDTEAMNRLQNAWERGQLRTVKTPYWRGGYFGRGHVQLTHRRNYKRMGELLGIDLVGNPSLALEPQISAKILIIGMMDGMFTGKKLADYINRDNADYRQARRVVNGMDRAELIAGHAEKFEAALRAARTAPSKPRTPEPAPTSQAPKPQSPLGLIVFAIIAAVLAYFGLTSSPS